MANGSDLHYSNNWLTMLKRVTGMAKTQHVNKAKIIKITLVTDSQGGLAVWSVPECTIIEPNVVARDWVNSL